MDDIQIQIGAHTTSVKVSDDLLDRIGAELVARLDCRGGHQVVLITDDRVGPIYAQQVLASLRGAGVCVFEFRLAAGEASKSLESAEAAYGFLAEHAISRDALIVALGGGVVSDLAGFVAATWMRGVRFVICPTTLESDVDACLGGKTAVNVPGGKNLVGAFHQPSFVAVDPNCLVTLEMRDIRAGLAESMKHAMITSQAFLEWHESNLVAILALDVGVLTELIHRNLRIKGAIVEQDAREQTGIRACLNFGHTMGHAIESCCGYRLRHGECVSLGMLAATRISCELGMLDAAISTRLEKLLGQAGLPTVLTEPISVDLIVDAIRLDKKARGGRVEFVLLESVGKPVMRSDVSESLVRKTFEGLVGRDF
jgi:3-dehydroquinate synthase